MKDGSVAEDPRVRLPLGLSVPPTESEVPDDMQAQMPPGGDLEAEASGCVPDNFQILLAGADPPRLHPPSREPPP